MDFKLFIMKTLRFILLTLGLLLFLNSYSALYNSFSANNYRNDSVKIDKINEYVQNVNKLLITYKTIEKNLYDVSTEGGKIKIYYDSLKFVKKIEITYYGEMGKSITNYYFRNRDLIKLEIVNTRYNKPAYISGSKEISHNITEYFLEQYTLIGIYNSKNRSITTKEKYIIDLEKFITRLLLLNHEFDFGKCLFK